MISGRGDMSEPYLGTVATIHVAPRFRRVESTWQLLVQKARRISGEKSEKTERRRLAMSRSSANEATRTDTRSAAFQGFVERSDETRTVPGRGCCCSIESAAIGFGSASPNKPIEEVVCCIMFSTVDWIIDFEIRADGPSFLELFFSSFAVFAAAAFLTASESFVTDLPPDLACDALPILLAPTLVFLVFTFPETPLPLRRDKRAAAFAALSRRSALASSLSDSFDSSGGSPDSSFSNCCPSPSSDAFMKESNADPELTAKSSSGTACCTYSVRSLGSTT
mmetsp:Transcript_4213/g.12100  ORF Transcript_4213/g.12100 Transcript_4213/m.12100 type:complete len:280 (+) Transcript_4213:89-928(+)